MGYGPHEDAAPIECLTQGGGTQGRQIRLPPTSNNHAKHQTHDDSPAASGTRNCSPVASGQQFTNDLPPTCTMGTGNGTVLLKGHEQSPPPPHPRGTRTRTPNDKDPPPYTHMGHGQAFDWGDSHLTTSFSRRHTSRIPSAPPPALSLA